MGGCVGVCNVHVYVCIYIYISLPSSNFSLSTSLLVTSWLTLGHFCKPSASQSFSAELQSRVLRGEARFQPKTKLKAKARSSSREVRMRVPLLLWPILEGNPPQKSWYKGTSGGPRRVR